MKKHCFLLLAWVCLGMGAGKAQFTTLLNFNGTNGSQPWGSLTLSGKVLYGMTSNGGASTSGCVFSIDTDGSNYKDLLDFNHTNGARPGVDLTLSGNKLYGMTEYGGANGDGVIFSIDTDGSNYKDLLDFNGANGQYPWGDLTLKAKRLYGITTRGGLYNQGCIFSIDTNGTDDTVIYNYGGEGSLLFAGNVIYGMIGAIFSIDTNGKHYRVIPGFSATKGGSTQGNKLTYSSGVFYGMTTTGGTYSSGNVFSIDTSGNNGKDLFDFNVTNGCGPIGSLTLSGEVLYGMTAGNGGGTWGNIFSIDTNGSNFKNLFSFSSNSSTGQNPTGSLTLSGRNLYGMTYEGGGNGDNGVVFKLDTANVGNSINQLSVDSGQLSVYPNPNNGQFTIQSSVGSSHPDSYRESVVEIYNVIGEKVLTETRQLTDDNLINLTEQPSGVYFYRVLTESGELIGEGKFVIE